MAMIFVVILFFVIASALAITTNPDIFSPGKIFLFLFMIFHMGAVFTGTSAPTSALMFLVLFVGIVTVLFEAFQVERLRRLRLAGVPSSEPLRAQIPYSPVRPAVLLWIASVPTILAQIYMVQQFGGIEGYVNNIGFRLVEWAGLGWAVVLTELIVPLNVLYFAIGIRRVHSGKWWLFFAAHFLIFLSMGLLSGSRGGLLVVFALNAIVYHYIRGPVKASRAGLVASALIIAAMALGAVRSTAKFQHGQFTTGSGGLSEAFNINAFYYGVQPLEVISEAAHMPLAHGSTFFSAVTNVIPRTIWPDKPDTGGVFFTENYFADAWGGYSYLTPTFLGEWVINFGWALGIFGFLASYILLMVWIVTFYTRTVTKLKSSVSKVAVIDFVIYVHVAWSSAALMVGEVTNTVHGLIITDVIPLLFIRFLVSRFAERRGTPLVLRPATIQYR